jgi:hypothetical protein
MHPIQCFTFSRAELCSPWFPILARGRPILVRLQQYWDVRRQDHANSGRLIERVKRPYDHLNTGKSEIPESKILVRGATPRSRNLLRDLHRHFIRKAALLPLFIYCGYNVIIGGS